MACQLGSFGVHSPANAGEGCDGCDTEHARVMHKHLGEGPYVDPFTRGAAVAFGLMGMAEAIQGREWGCLTCDALVTGRRKCDWCGSPRTSGDDRSPAHE